MVQGFNGNVIYQWEQYVSVKLQQVQRNYRLRNHFGMRVTILIPVVNCWNRINKSILWINQYIYSFKKSWHRLRIKEMIQWRPFCRIMKRLNVINVNSEYCVKRVTFFSTLDLFVTKIFRRQKTSILMSKFDIQRFNGFHYIYVFF